MRKLLLFVVVSVVAFGLASAQSNKIVFGPLEGDEAGF